MPPLRRVGLVTARAARDLDEDLPPLLAALAGRGVAARVVAWDDPEVDWASLALAVVRSTWDYPARRDEFVAWADAVAAVTDLCNPAPVLRWNTDKRYLADLAAAGVPVVPTQWFAPGEEVSLPGGRTGDVVVKPAVSAGARDTTRHAAADPAVAVRVAALTGAGRMAMLQPYLRGIDEHGETAVVYVGGEYSHGLRKGPLLRPGGGAVEGLFAVEEMGPRDPSPAERAVAEAALAAVPGGASQLLYARVDLVPAERGEPVVIELELTEPSLFHAHAPGSADRFAAAIERRLAQERG